MILLPKVPERADNQWGTLPFVEAGHISHTGISQKEPSSFRTHGKPFIDVTRWKIFRASFSHTSFRLAQNRKPFGWDWKIVRRRTFYHFLQGKTAERCPKYLSDHKSLYDKHIPYNLKNERTFPKTLGRDIYCAKVTPNPYVTSHLHTVNADKHWPHEIHHLLHHKTGDAVLTSPKCFWYVILVNVSQPSYHSLYRFPDG